MTQGDRVASEAQCAVSPTEEELRTEINKFRVADKFGSVRLQMVDKLMAKIKTGLSDEDRMFLSKLLSVGNKTADRPWLYDWLHDEKLNRNKFRDLVEYPALTVSQLGHFTFNCLFIIYFSEMTKAFN